MLTKEQKDKLNTLKSELSTLKTAKLSKRINTERIANLEREIRKITNPEITNEAYRKNCFLKKDCQGCDIINDSCTYST